MTQEKTLATTGEELVGVRCYAPRKNGRGRWRVKVVQAGRGRLVKVEPVANCAGRPWWVDIGTLSAPRTRAPLATALPPDCPRCQGRRWVALTIISSGPCPACLPAKP